MMTHPGKKCHRCSVPGCGAELPAHQLMCRSHWKRLPYRLRAEVWSAWDGWRCGRLDLEQLREVQARATAFVVGTAKGGAA